MCRLHGFLAPVFLFLALLQLGCLAHILRVWGEVRTFHLLSGLYSDLLRPRQASSLMGGLGNWEKIKRFWSGFRRNSRELPQVSCKTGVPALHLERTLSGDMGKRADSSGPNDTNKWGVICFPRLQHQSPHPCLPGVCHTLSFHRKAA